MSGIALFDWSHESDKLAWNDPVKISVFDLLIILIFLDIEGLKVVPAESHSVLKSLEDVVQGAIVEAVSLGGISVMLEQTMVWFEHSVSLVSSHLEDDHHEGTHEESSVDHSVSSSSRATVVEDFVLRIALISKKSCELSGVSVHHSQVKWSEILVEREVSEVVVNVEEECVLVVLWSLGITDPIEFIYNISKYILSFYLCGTYLE